MSSTLVCPDCDARVRTKSTVEPGKKVRCPKCEAVFVVPEDDEEPEEESAAIQASPSRRSSRVAAVDDAAMAGVDAVERAHRDAARPPLDVGQARDSHGRSAHDLDEPPRSAR